jgi:hypothetical protein
VWWLQMWTREGKDKALACALEVSKTDEVGIDAAGYIS